MIRAKTAHYRVESGTSDTGRVRPAEANHHEFEAADDDQACRIATTYAVSQHGPNTRSQVYRQTFLGWVPVAELVTPCPCGNHTCADAFTDGVKL